MSNTLRRAVFLDKDGTLVEDVPYNVDPARIRLKEGAAEAARSLKEAGFQLIVVTNQSGVARGLFPIAAIAAMRSRMEQLMADRGAPLNGFYFCPHLREGVVPEFSVVCECRKPAPGLILRAASENAIDLSKSWFVGDKTDDVEAGRRAGCRTVLISQSSSDFHADSITLDLPSAARFILSSAAVHPLVEKWHGHN